MNMEIQFKGVLNTRTQHGSWHPTLHQFCGLSEINEEAFVGLNVVLHTSQWGGLGLLNSQVEGPKI